MSTAFNAFFVRREALLLGHTLGLRVDPEGGRRTLRIAVEWVRRLEATLGADTVHARGTTTPKSRANNTAPLRPTAGRSWPPVRAKLTGDPAGLALMGAMEDEHKLIDPLLAAIDDALASDTDDKRLRSLPSQLRTTLASHLAHEEADALPLISKVMSPAELTRIRKAIAKMSGLKHAAAMFPWALSTARPEVRAQFLRQLPAPARLLYRARWLPRYRRDTPPL